MSKWSFVAILLLSIGMAGCMGDSGGRANRDAGNQNENAGIAGDTQSFADRNIDEKIDENLYVQAEFHMPEQELFTYSSKLKKFDNKVQSVFWKNADAGKIKKDEFGSRYYGGAELGIGGMTA